MLQEIVKNYMQYFCSATSLIAGVTQIIDAGLPRVLLYLLRQEDSIYCYLHHL